MCPLTLTLSSVTSTLLNAQVKEWACTELLVNWGPAHDHGDFITFFSLEFGGPVGNTASRANYRKVITRTLTLPLDQLLTIYLTNEPANNQPTIRLRGTLWTPSPTPTSPSPTCSQIYR